MDEKINKAEVYQQFVPKRDFEEVRLNSDAYGKVQ